MTSSPKSLLAATESVCPECLTRVPAFRVRRGPALSGAEGADVYLTKVCETHGVFETILWRGEPAYETWVRPKIPTTPETPFTQGERGCPLDCGLCPDHRKPARLESLADNGRAPLHHRRRHPRGRAAFRLRLAG